jgi:hypothetical protein
LPEGFYAESEQVAGQTGPDMLSLDAVEPIAVGTSLPAAALFLDPEWYVAVPLENSYCAAWEAVPVRWRRVLSE